MSPDQSIALGIAALVLIGNALMLTYAWQQNMLGHLFALYVLLGIGVVVLPNGGPQWFLLAVWLAVAVRSGYLLVRLQQAKAAR